MVLSICFVQRTLERWEDKHVRLLIESYLKFKGPIEDNNKQTGRAHKTWKFHKEMEQCIGDKASVRPVFTFDSGSSTSSSTRSQSPQTIDDISDAENASDSVD